MRSSGSCSQAKLSTKAGLFRRSSQGSIAIMWRRRAALTPHPFDTRQRRGAGMQWCAKLYPASLPCSLLSHAIGRRDGDASDRRGNYDGASDGARGSARGSASKGNCGKRDAGARRKGNWAGQGARARQGARAEYNTGARSGATSGESRRRHERDAASERPRAPHRPRARGAVYARLGQASSGSYSA